MNENIHAMYLSNLVRISNRLHALTALYALDLSKRLADDEEAVNLIRQLSRNLLESEDISIS